MQLPISPRTCTYTLWSPKTWHDTATLTNLLTQFNYLRTAVTRNDVENEVCLKNWGHPYSLLPPLPPSLPPSLSHDLLPPERDPSVSLRLRHSTVYPIPQIRTKRYCSFINYSLKHYQWQLCIRNSAILFHILLFMSIFCTYAMGASGFT